MLQRNNTILIVCISIVALVSMPSLDAATIIPEDSFSEAFVKTLTWPQCEVSTESRIKAICGGAKAAQKKLALHSSGCGKQNASQLAAANATVTKAQADLKEAKTAYAKAHGFAQAESDEAAWDHLEALSTLKELNERCAVAASQFTKASSTFVKCMSRVKTSTALEEKICSAQVKAEKRADKERKAITVTGPTFKFTPDPCKGGSGSFTTKLKFRERVNVGVIPSNQFNVKVQLRTEKDIDAELWSTDSTVALVAWKCKKHNKRLGSIEHKACIDSAYKQKKTVKYGNATIDYSGYLGLQDMFGHNFGHEDINVVGKSTKPLLVKAFAYEVGTARVKYSWGVDKKSCAIKRATARKESLAKYNAKKVAKIKFKESGYKAVKWVLNKSKQNCADAEKAVDLAQKKLIQAENSKHLSADKVAQCRKEKARNQAHVAALKKRRAELAKKHSHVLSGHIGDVEARDKALDDAELNLAKVKKEAAAAVEKCRCGIIKQTRATFNAAKKAEPKKQAAIVREALLLCLAKNRGKKLPPSGPCKKSGAKLFCSGWSTRFLSVEVFKLLATSTPHCPAPNLNWRHLQHCITEPTMMCIKKSLSLPDKVRSANAGKCMADMLRKQAKYKSCMRDISDLTPPEVTPGCAA